MGLQINYKPDGRTLCDFMRSDKFFRGIRGPVGSGKSVCSAMELYRRATQRGLTGFLRSPLADLSGRRLILTASELAILNWR